MSFGLLPLLFGPLPFALRFLLPLPLRFTLRRPLFPERQLRFGPLPFTLRFQVPLLFRFALRCLSFRARLRLVRFALLRRLHFRHLHGRQSRLLLPFVPRRLRLFPLLQVRFAPRLSITFVLGLIVGRRRLLQRQLRVRLNRSEVIILAARPAPASPGRARVNAARFLQHPARC